MSYIIHQQPSGMLTMLTLPETPSYAIPVEQVKKLNVGDGNRSCTELLKFRSLCRKQQPYHIQMWRQNNMLTHPRNDHYYSIIFEAF